MQGVLHSIFFYRHALISSHCPLPGLGDSVVEFKLCRASAGSVCSAPLRSGPLQRCSAPRLTSAPFWAASIGFERCQLWRRLISRGFYFHRFGWASSSRAKSSNSRAPPCPADSFVCLSLSISLFFLWCCLLLLFCYLLMLFTSPITTQRNRSSRTAHCVGCCWLCRRLCCCCCCSLDDCQTIELQLQIRCSICLLAARPQPSVRCPRPKTSAISQLLLLTFFYCSCTTLSCRIEYRKE